MKASLALEHLEFLLRLTQKTRSNILEGLAKSSGRSDNDDLDWRIAESLFPWLFGPKDITLPLNQEISRIHSGAKQLEPIEFYNFMFIVDQTDILREGARMWGHVLPEPTPTLVLDWEPE